MNLLPLFDKASDIQEFRQGTKIFEEGDQGDEMFVILQGEVELSVGGHVLDEVGAGDIIGEMALIKSNARSATAVAKTDGRMVPVNRKRFLFMVEETPFFALHVMEVLADRLRRMNERV
jgi:CRP-like cAMP-binding protein